MSTQGGGTEERAGAPAAPVTEQAVQAWLVENLARRLKLDPAEVDVKAPFSRFGLDSQEGAGLQGELETWLGRELPPTLVWDYPTIEQVARYVVGK